MANNINNYVVGEMDTSQSLFSAGPCTSHHR